MIVEELGCQNAQGVQRASAKNGRRRGTLPDPLRFSSSLIYLQARRQWFSRFIGKAPLDVWINSSSVCGPIGTILDEH